MKQPQVTKAKLLSITHNLVTITHTSKLSSRAKDAIMEGISQLQKAIQEAS